MLARIIIIIVGAGFAGYCFVTAILTLLGRNAATLHLSKFFLFGYAAINAVLIPFGISGVIGGVSRRKTLVKAFVTLQWWLSTFILIGISVINVILSKKNEGDSIRKCQINLARGQPESNFLARCVAIVNDAERATFIAACAQGVILLFLGIILLIVGMREYNNISMEEETNDLLEKANFNENNETEDLLSSETPLRRNLSNTNNGGNFNNVGAFVPDSYDLGRYSPTKMTGLSRLPTNASTIRQPSNATASLSRLPTNASTIRQPSNATMNLARLPTNASTRRQPSNATMNLSRPPTNASTINAVQYSSLRRNPTDPSTTFMKRNQMESNFVPPSHKKGLSRSQTSPGNIPARYPTNDYPTNESANRANVTRQPTIGNAYAMNYVEAPQATDFMVPKRSLSTEQYINPPSPSYVTQIMIPPPIINKQNNIQNNISPVSEVEYNDYSDDYNNIYSPKPYNMTPASYLTRMGNN